MTLDEVLHIEAVNATNPPCLERTKTQEMLSLVKWALMHAYPLIKDLSGSMHEGWAARAHEALLSWPEKNEKEYLA